MRNQTANNFEAIHANQNQFTGNIKSTPVKKNPRYIYTEEDLGEGILDVGLSAYHITGQQNNLITKPWSTMLRTTGS